MLQLVAARRVEMLRCRRAAADLCPWAPTCLQVFQPMLAKAVASHRPGAPILHCCFQHLPLVLCFPCLFPQSFQINSIPTPGGNAEKRHV